MSVPSEDRLMDIYKLAVEMADRVSARRASANAFFTSVQSAVVATLGILATRTPPPPDGALLAVAAVGILGACVWYALLSSYRTLNRAKFEVILELEKGMPTRIFTDEWASVKRDPVKWWGGRYVELAAVERLAPVLFAALSLVAGTYLVIS